MRRFISAFVPACVLGWLLLVELVMPMRAQLPMNIPDLCAGSPDNVTGSVTWSTPQTKSCLGISGTVTLSSALTVDTIIVYSGGFLDVQSGGSITFRDFAMNTSTDPRQWGHGLIAIGRVRMLGTTKTPFRRVTNDVLAGQSVILVSPAPTGWSAGDEVFIPDTRQTPENDRYNPAYALRHEIRTIASVNSGTVTLTAPLTYDHRGARNANGTVNSGFLPHLVNLTRSITVRSANANGTRAHSVYTDRANVEIRNTVFRDMGRTTTDAVLDADASPNQIGRYPVHIHMLRGPVNPGNTGYQFTLVGNVVRDTRKWPVAIHGSHYGLVEDNVIVGGSQLSGAGIALEDGSETENMIRGNFVGDIRGQIDPRNTGTGTESDGTHPGSGGECIWAAGFNNRFINNVLTGCRNSAQNIVSGVGFKFFVNAAPSSTVVLNPTIRGAAANEMVSVISQNQPILEFDGNEVYGVAADGLTIWRLGTDGYGWNTSQSETNIKNFKVWHVNEGGIWFYPVNKIKVENMSMRIDAAVSRPPAIVAGDDYRVVNFTMTGGDIHAGAVLSCNARDPLETHRFEGVIATTYGEAFCFETPATPGTGASRPSSGVTFNLVGNVITAWPGQPLRTIGMFHTTARANNDPGDPYIVNVEDHQGVLNDDFRTCFPIQETQNLYGGTCTAGTPRADIQALVTGTAPPTPPPPPVEVCGNGLDDDGDGQIDEGCATDPPAEVCGDGIDNDRDGSIDEDCTPPPPPPPVDDVPTTPTGPITLPTLQIIGSDMTVSGVERTWNASSPTSYTFPFDPTRATFGQTGLFLNPSSGTFALAFRVDSGRLSALGQDSSLGLMSWRPEPDINIHTAPVRSLQVYRGDPGANPMIRAVEGRNDDTVSYATSAPLSTLTSTTTAIVTWTPTSFSLYVNGVLVDTRARTPYISSQTRMMLAVSPELVRSSSQQFLRGVTREPVVYARVLDATEVLTLHQSLIAGVPAPDPPPPDPPPPCVLTVSPTSINWSVQQGQIPQPSTISVSTSCGSNWSTFEESPFFDTTAACAFSTCVSPGTTTVTPLPAFFAAATAGTVSANLQILVSGGTTVVVPVTATITALPPPPPPPEVCGDGVDNDGDGQIDEGCPVTPPPAEVCGNNIDDDGDGIVDEGCPVTTAPTVTIRYCTVILNAPKPDATTGWRAQYYNGTTALTSRSTTVQREVRLNPAVYSIHVKWSKSGSGPVLSTSAATPYTCN